MQDASAAMGANLALATRKVIFFWTAAVVCRPTRRFGFNFAYDGGVFNGLLCCVLFICGTFKKMKTAPIWHVIDWFSTACCLYGARLKNENRA
jgi:hypothetical protein